MGKTRADACVGALRKRYPELAGEPLRVVSSGHQNLIVVAGERLVFRFPLTSDLASLKLEQRLLPKLGRRLPLPVPQFRYESAPKDKIRFVGYPIIPGVPLEGEALNKLDPMRRQSVVRQIAGFLTAMHEFDDDPITRVDPKRFREEWRRNWGGYYRAVELEVFPKIGRRERLWVMEMFYSYLYPSDHFKFKPCLLHGDFKNDHIFHDPDTGKLTGVIDFGQLKMGDPAYDYHDLFLTYGEPFMRQVYDCYEGPKDKTFLGRVTDFYAHLLRLSSLLLAVRNKDREKFEKRYEWLKAKARGAKG